MRWNPNGGRQWFSECGRGRVADYSNDSEPDYFAMWYRLEPGRGPWLQVKTPSGRVTYRRSLPAACEAVREAVDNVDRVKTKEAA